MAVANANEELISDTATVSVSHLSLNEDAEVLENDNVKNLFVAYDFLNIDPKELETPFSLPKPNADERITYNFSKNFAVDMEGNSRRRQFLAAMLLPDDPDQGRIRFTVESEPPDDDKEAECEDIGVAFVSVRDILKYKRDVTEQNINIYDAKRDSVVIGCLNVTVQCLAALQAIEEEMKQRLSQSDV